MSEMSEQARGVIFVILVVAITFLWMHFYGPPPPQPQKTGQTAGAMAPGQAGGASQSGSAQATMGSAPSKPVVVPVVQASSDKLIVIDSTLFRVELSNRGGVVRSWKLNKFFDDQNPPRPLDLVNPSSAQELGWPFSLMLADPQLEAEANSALYTVTPDGASLDAPTDITFHWSDGHLDVTKKLSFTQDYQLSVEVSASLDGRPIPAGIAWRGGFGDKAVRNASQLVGVFYKQAGKLTVLQYKKLGVSGNQLQPFEQPGSVEFAGIEDQFFAAAFIPDGSDITLWQWTQYHHFTGADNQPTNEPEAEMAAGPVNPVPVKMRVFVGPKDLGLLIKQQPSLEQLVNLGWFGVIAKPLLFALQWLHRYILNWGWSIVALTLAINLALFPLKMKSWRSMQQMQKIAPEMRAINDRYKKYSMTDPRRKKMQEETMELYAKHGINPLAQMSGCLPMLVQMPFLYAFYRVLSGAIELRHAPWILWIHDLSAKDPYYILPIAMAATSYLMTKTMPQSPAVDPAQQKMMSFLPLMLIFIFFQLSSGLNLYYFTSNVVGVGQQYYLSRTQPMPSRSKFKKNKQQ